MRIEYCGHRLTRAALQPLTPDNPGIHLMRANGTIVSTVPEGSDESVILERAYTVRASHCSIEGIEALPFRPDNGWRQETCISTRTLDVTAGEPLDIDDPLACAQAFVDGLPVPDDGVEHAYGLISDGHGVYAMQIGTGSVQSVLPDWTLLLAFCPSANWDWVVDLHTHPGGTPPSVQDSWAAWYTDRQMSSIGYKGMSAFATINMVTRLIEPYDPQEPPKQYPEGLPPDLAQKILDAIMGKDKDTPKDKPKRKPKAKPEPEPEDAGDDGEDGVGDTGDTGEPGVDDDGGYYPDDGAPEEKAPTGKAPEGKGGFFIPK